MRKLRFLPCIGCLVAGILVGLFLPNPWAPTSFSPMTLRAPAGSGAAETSALSQGEPEPLDSRENFPLLNTAEYIVRALKEEDYAAVASLVHPEKGVTFTPYSTVDFNMDLNFSREEIRDQAEDGTVYTWGFADGRGSLITMTMSQYIQDYVFDADYTRAPQIGVDQIITSGNALENLTEAYPGCRFVDFCFPTQAPADQRQDWTSLKLVFEPSKTNWYLVGVVHGEWTI